MGVCRWISELIARRVIFPSSETNPPISPSCHQFIVNKGLKQTIMSTSLKQTVVTPFLTKTSLDKENVKNYQAVSNLPYLGKCIEKVAIKQMEDHLSENNLHEPLQSAYKTYHSTETAQVQVTILLALD